MAEGIIIFKNADGTCTLTERGTWYRVLDSNTPGYSDVPEKYRSLFRWPKEITTPVMPSYKHIVIATIPAFITLVASKLVSELTEEDILQLKDKFPDGIPTKINGSGQVIAQIETFEETYDRIGEEALQAIQPFRITTRDKLPSDGLDRTYREAWTDDYDTETVDINMEKAKVLHMKKIRAARNAKWIDFDKRYMVAERDGIDLSDLKVERQKLKDIPNNIQANIDMTTTIEELKALWPEELN